MAGIGGHKKSAHRGKTSTTIIPSPVEESVYNETFVHRKGLSINDEGFDITLVLNSSFGTVVAGEEVGEAFAAPKAKGGYRIRVIEMAQGIDLGGTVVERDP